MTLREIGVDTKSWFDTTQNTNYQRAVINATLKLGVPIARKIVQKEKFNYKNIVELQ